MVRHLVTAGVRVYQVVDDCRTEYRVFVVGHLYDAVSGQLIENFRVNSDNLLLKFKLVSPGLFILSGQADRILPDPTGIYPLHITLTAPDYPLLERDVLLNATGVFPVDIGDLRLNPVPVSVQGRVISKNGSGGSVPVAGARIKLIDNPNVPPPTTHDLVLGQPLAFDHVTNTTIRECQLAPSGNQRHVVFAVPSGSTILPLDDVSGLAVGQVVRVGTSATYCVIAALGPRSYEITLNRPLRASLLPWASVQVVMVSVPGGSVATQITQAASGGDGLLIVAQVLDVQNVEIDAGANIEYGDVGTVTDADGYYRLDGIGHVQSIFLDAEAAGFPPNQEPVHLLVDYGKSVNKIDFTLKL